MSQNRVRVPEPQGLGHKRTSSEDNLYRAVLRASEGKKGSGHSRQSGQAAAGGAHFLCQEACFWLGVGPSLGGFETRAQTLRPELGPWAVCCVRAQVQTWGVGPSRRAGSGPACAGRAGSGFCASGLGLG